MSLNVANLISNVIEEANQKTKAIIQRASVLTALEDTGMIVNNPYGLVRWGYVDVERSDLPTIRKVVGRLSLTGKNCAWNFKDTNELEVQVIPVDKDKPVTFRYRTKFRKGGKCKVIENVEPSMVRTSLVCEK